MIGALCIIFLCVVLHCIAEVFIGGTPGIYGAELGLDLQESAPVRISFREFLTREAPLVAAAIAFPVSLTML